MGLLVIRDIIFSYMDDNYQTVSNIPYYDREAVSEYRNTPVKTGDPYILIDFTSTKRRSLGLGSCCFQIEGIIAFHLIWPSADDFRVRAEEAEKLRGIWPEKLASSGPASQMVIENKSIPSSLGDYAFPEVGNMTDHCFYLEFNYGGAE